MSISTDDMLKPGSNKKQGLKEIYKITYLAVVNQMIHESKYIDVLQKISVNGFKTYHIDDFDKMIAKLSEVGLMDSYHISILLHFRDNYYKKISIIATKFSDIGTIFSKKKKKMIDRVSLIYKNLKIKLNIIKSFTKFNKFERSEIESNSNININSNAIINTDNIIDIDINNDNDSISPNETDIDTGSDMESVDSDIDKFIDANIGADMESIDSNIDKFIDANINLNLINDISINVDGDSDSDIDIDNNSNNSDNSDRNRNNNNSDRNKLKIKEVEDMWMYYNRQEIIDRLHLIIKYYDIVQLLFMAIELKTLSELEDMEYIKLEEYYFITIKNIEKVLKTWTHLCKMYIHVDKNYIKYCKYLIKNFNL